MKTFKEYILETSKNDDPKKYLIDWLKDHQKIHNLNNNQIIGMLEEIIDDIKNNNF